MAISTITREKKKRGFASLLGQFGEPHAGNQLMSLAPVAEPRTVNLTERLNAMIAAGASFNVSTDAFQVCGADDLTQAGEDFLTINKIYILCTLQQALLMKYLPLDLIPDYIFEVRERAAIQAFDDDTLSDPPFEIVRDVTKEWFADVLDAMPEPATTL